MGRLLTCYVGLAICLRPQCKWCDLPLGVADIQIVENFVHQFVIIFNCSKDVRLPVQLQRAMAAEAEAAREARAKVIAAEGEQKASRALREAAEVISESPSALQVRLM